MEASVVRDQDGGIVLGWLLRLTVALLLLGVVGFDVMSLAYTNVTTVDDAGIVAGAAGEVLLESPGAYDRAKEQSVAKAEELGVRMRGRDWWVDDTGEVHVTVSRRAKSLALHYVPRLDKYLVVRAVGTASSS